MEVMGSKNCYQVTALWPVLRTCELDNKLFEVVANNILNGKVKTERLQLAVVLYDRENY